VRIIYVTDGAASHTGSAAFPRERLRALREAEAVQALLHLAPRAEATFCAWPDGTVPAADDARAPELLDRMRPHLPPDALVLAPWRRDPHPDHCAVAQLARALVAERDDVRYAEYFVWLDERGADADAPAHGEGRPLALDIGRFVTAKQAALGEHRSQLGDVISDAREAFVLPARLIAGLARPVERYVMS
jgi:LmbE family N-acetylglucosaminyl deacetylase